VSELTGVGLGAMQLTFGVAALLLVVTGQLSAEANPVPSPANSLG
jgi:hypothetical protein